MTEKTFHSTLSDVSPRGLVYLCLLGGLLLVAYGAATRNWAFFAGATVLPLAILTLIQVLRNPLWSFLFAGITLCYFSAIYRYSNISGLSGIIDVVLGISLLSLIVNTINRNPDIHWKNAINALTVTQFIWILFCLFSLFSPDTEIHNFIRNRSVFIGTPLLYLLASILMEKPKLLKYVLFLLGIFVATAAFKIVWQKYKGFDAAETRFLLEEEAWRTHILSSGKRFFSFYSDAGNMGSSMGMFVIIFGILTLVVKRRIAQLFCLAAALMALYGMFMSGTRGAIIVPLGGILLYTFLCRNFKLMLTCVFLGTLTFSFFYFTDIGESNQYIRRMRTAFRPTEDASFNVRLQNQELLKYYLQDKPLGVGLGGEVYDTEHRIFVDDNWPIPPDSFFVNIWMQHGIVGLCLYIGILAFILLRCSYLIMFRIKNDQLRQILAALLCGVFGLWLNGYVGRGMGMNPSSFIIPLFLAFVLNGPFMDKTLKKDEKFI